MQPVQEEDYKGFRYKIIQDEDPDSPRNWDNLGEMICFHSRYMLGDKHSYSTQEARAMYEDKNRVSLPLYLYDHSGLTINTTGFSCPWDSGQVGIITVTREKILKEYSAKKLTKRLREKVVDVLRSEVHVYDQFLTGDVYGYEIYELNDAGENDDPEERDFVDSCWGFFGLEYCEQEAREMIEHLAVKKAEREQEEREQEEREEKARAYYEENVEPILR